MDPLLFFQLVINGLFLGSVYSLTSIGLTLIYGTMDIINFAHGELFMLGMYVSFWFWALLVLDPLLSLFIIFPLFYVLGYVLQKILIKPILGQPLYAQMLMTFGLLLVIQHLVVTFWSANYKRIMTPYSDLTFWVGGIFIHFPQLISFIAAFTCSILLYLFLTRTYTGTAIRATAQDSETAEVLGIDTEKVYAISFGLGTACAGIAGTLVSTYFPFDPYVGTMYVVLAFIVVVLGGLGNYIGAFIGGLIIGVVQTVTAYEFSLLKLTVPLLIFLIVLLIRPEGLFMRRLRQ